MHTAPRTRAMRLILVWVAVTAALLSTGACTKKSAPPQAKRQAPAAQRQAPDSSVSEMDEKSGTSSQEVITQADAESADEAIVIADEIREYDPRGKTPDEIFAQDDSVQGGRDSVRSGRDSVDGSDLFYSGSGKDSLYEQVKARLDSVEDEGMRTQNRELAQMVGLTGFKMDWRKRVGEVSMEIETLDGYKAKFLFKGRLDNSLRLRAGSLDREPYLRLNAVCMDLRGGCQTVHVKLEERDPETNAIREAHVIARDTNVALYIQGRTYGESQNPEYDRFLSVLLNTVHSPGDLPGITSLRLITSETVNGRALFMVRMMMGLEVGRNRFPSVNHQALFIRGPLVKKAATSHLSVEADVLEGANYLNGRRVLGRTTIADTIREARLVRNDGLGNLQMAVTIRKPGQAAQEDTLTLTFARIHKPVRPLILD